MLNFLKKKLPTVFDGEKFLWERSLIFFESRFQKTKLGFRSTISGVKMLSFRFPLAVLIAVSICATAVGQCADGLCPVPQAVFFPVEKLEVGNAFSPLAPAPRVDQSAPRIVYPAPPIYSSPQIFATPSYGPPAVQAFGGYCESSFFRE